MLIPLLVLGGVIGTVVGGIFGGIAGVKASLKIYARQEEKMAQQALALEQLNLESAEKIQFQADAPNQETSQKAVNSLDSILDRNAYELSLQLLNGSKEEDSFANIDR